MNPRKARTVEEFRAAARRVLEERAEIGAIFEDNTALQYASFGGQVAFALGIGVIDDDQAAELMTTFSIATAAAIRPVSTDQPRSDA